MGYDVDGDINNGDNDDERRTLTIAQPRGHNVTWSVRQAANVKSASRLSLL